MNRRIRLKKAKQKLYTPTRYIATGGFLTPYACPNCGALYSYKAAQEIDTCPDCGQKLIWWDTDPRR